MTDCPPDPGGRSESPDPEESVRPRKGHPRREGIGYARRRRQPPPPHEPPGPNDRRDRSEPPCGSPLRGPRGSPPGGWRHLRSSEREAPGGTSGLEPPVRLTTAQTRDLEPPGWVPAVLLPRR